MSIVKLTIVVGGKDITVSLEEAEKLYQELGVLFNTKNKWVPPILSPGFPLENLEKYRQYPPYVVS